MKLPKYLIADNANFENDIFVVHTDFPRFIINLHTDEIEWLDAFSEQDAKDNADVIEAAVKGSYDFFDAEMKRYES